MTHYGLRISEYRACRACTCALAPAADEYNLNVVDCNALSLSHAGLPSQSVGVWGVPPAAGGKRTAGGTANVKWFSVASPGPAGNFFYFFPGAGPAPGNGFSCSEREPWRVRPPQCPTGLAGTAPLTQRSHGGACDGAARSERSDAAPCARERRPRFCAQVPACVTPPRFPLLTLQSRLVPACASLSALHFPRRQ